MKSIIQPVRPGDRHRGFAPLGFKSVDCRAGRAHYVFFFSSSFLSLFPLLLLLLSDRVEWREDDQSTETQPAHRGISAFNCRCMCCAKMCVCVQEREGGRVSERASERTVLQQKACASNRMVDVFCFTPFRPPQLVMYHDVPID